MTPRETLLALVQRWTGITLTRGGTEVALDRFVAARMAELKLDSLIAYIALLTSPEAPETQRLIDAVTVNHTWFFRDPEQLEVLAAIMREQHGLPRPFRIWIPACASGEDPYTVAMLAARAGCPVEVLGTDINGAVLETARRGRYPAAVIKDIPPDLQRFALPAGDVCEIAPSIKQCVSFVRHNVIELPPTSRQGELWDAILCRNMLIYFEREHIVVAIERFAQALAPGGALLLGAGDVVFDTPPGFRAVYVQGRLVLERLSVRDFATGAVPRAPSVLPALSLTAPLSPLPLFAAPPLAADSPILASLVPIAAAAHIAPGPMPHKPAHATDDDARALVSRGNAYLERGDFSEALSLYAEACALSPAFAEAQLFAGIAHHGRGDIDAAIEALRTCVMLDARLWPASFYLARCYEQAGHDDEADREYARLIDVGHEPLSLQTHSHLAHDWHAYRHDITVLSKRRLRARNDASHVVKNETRGARAMRRQ